MRKVKILSGNLTGHVMNQRDDEAENNVVTGFAEYVNPPEVPPEVKAWAGVLPPDASVQYVTTGDTDTYPRFTETYLGLTGYTPEVPPEIKVSAYAVPPEVNVNPVDQAIEAFHTVGGWYELPGGERIRGKENARAALEKMRG